ncbi:neutral cholesterol ester hydrolase 1 [Strongylocentrotus purpuratus]|uniref:Alpha/beta hydrolase fold-3 domain-containing protein n=1 Tax=Strongylocentrotus purpuratus TaxID=7668 RepID=A0A7M7RGJ2_STRPU|nr:neutral cholesterol ester hydrolase 1 [Strongylocentrotus purpuratus]
MKAYSSVLVLGLALLMGYLVYTPIPEGMLDQWQYRLMTAGAKTAALAATLRTYIQPGDDDVYYRTISSLCDMVLPAADKKVQGSNVKAQYAEFEGVRVLVYTPLTERRGLAPGLVYYHGGGFGFASTKTNGRLTRYLAEQLDMVVISVDYRLAPAHPFPAAVEDSFTATKWFLDHAHEYGVDADRVVVSGDSAGGFLTAVIVQLVHDDPSLPEIKLQVLFYPWTQCFDFNTPSYQKYEVDFGETGMVAKPRMAEFVSAYLLGRFDKPFMKQLQKNEHVSAAFKQSKLYRAVFNHTIIRQHPGVPLTSLPSQQKIFQGGNDTLWEDIKDRLLDPRLSPLFRKDFKGLPAAFIATADLDSLRDDGIFYARLLAEAGVEVTLKNYLGAYHGIAAAGPITNIPTGVQMLNDSIEFIRDNV